MTTTTPTSRIAVARFADLAKARQAADKVVARRVPDSAIHVTAESLHPERAPTTDASYWTAFITGLRSGALFGAVFGLVWSVSGLDGGFLTMLPSLLIGTLIGAGLGALFGVASHWGERDPSHGRGLLRAEEFHMLIDEDYEAQAREALSEPAHDASGRFSSSQR